MKRLTGADYLQLKDKTNFGPYKERRLRRQPHDGVALAIAAASPTRRPAQKWCENYNNYGQTAVPKTDKKFIAISAGYWHSLGLLEDGSVLAWGDNIHTVFCFLK